MMNFAKKFAIIFLSFSLISSCSYRPILDQNATYLKVGDNKAQEDVDQCTKKAKAYLKKYKAKRAAKEAARKGAIGAVIGGVAGFLFGGNSRSLLKGLAVGAGVGAATGALSVAGEGKVSPDQIKRRYVSNCLARKGYAVIGWE